MSSSIASDYYSNFQVWMDGKAAAIPKCLLPLSSDHHKGSSGRIAVLGGSARYTGAPYYASMAALNAGADLVTVFTAQEAATPLKSYSPALMVDPVYSATQFDRVGARVDTIGSEIQAEPLIQTMVEAVTANLEGVHCLVLGPGLGRCPVVLRAVAQIIAAAKRKNVYLVLDADALYLLAQPEYRYILQGYDKAVLTPNVMECQRLFEGIDDEEDDPFESVTIVVKGHKDQICLNGTTLISCTEEGGLKRAGGLGDVLAGTLGTLIAWHKILLDSESTTTTVDLQLACWTACCLVKQATRKAFQKKRRAMSAMDVLDELGATMDEMESVWV